MRRLRTCPLHDTDSVGAAGTVPGRTRVGECAAVTWSMIDRMGLCTVHLGDCKYEILNDLDQFTEII